MAFEQNQQLQRLMNPMGMQLPQANGMNPLSSYGNPLQGPRLGTSPLSSTPQNFWQNLGSFFLGNPAQQMYTSPYTGYQSQGFNQLLGMGLQNLQNPYSGWEDLRNSILSDYQQNILPGITEQFTSMGGGALSSPDFAKQITAGNQGLASLLLAHRINLANQNRQFGLQQAQLGLTPQYENAYVPRTPGVLEDLWSTGKDIARHAIPFGIRALAGGF